MTLAMHNSLAAYPIAAHGKADQKERWLPILAESIGAVASIEPEAGSDSSQLATRAMPAGDSYIITGVKVWVAHATLAKTLIVLAQMEQSPSSGGTGGPALFVVDPAAPGIKIGHREPTMGLRGVTFNTVYFDTVEVPASERLGNAGEGLTIMSEAITQLRLAVAAGALGLAQNAVALGRAFAIERKQFGVAIATKQAIGNYFADCDTDIEALRHLIEYAVWLAAEGKDHTPAVIKAKMFGAKVARDAANRMLQVHGGYGFSSEYAISQLYRDARSLDFIGGTPQLGRVSIAQQVFADSGLVIKP
jgi:butyryl-CoA dehydrogenase